MSEARKKLPSASGWYAVSTTPAFDAWAIGPFTTKKTAMAAKREEVHLRNGDASMLRVAYLVETVATEDQKTGLAAPEAARSLSAEDVEKVRAGLESHECECVTRCARVEALAILDKALKGTG